MPFSPPEDLPDPEIELESLLSPALAGGFSTAEPLGSTFQNDGRILNNYVPNPSS